jgi:ABC-type dipeptide/oligopeptide/nickel transport system permease component
MGTALLVAVVVVCGSLLMDLTYAFLDPRVRLS